VCVCVSQLCAGFGVFLEKSCCLLGVLVSPPPHVCVCVCVCCHAAHVSLCIYFLVHSIPAATSSLLFNNAAQYFMRIKLSTQFVHPNAT